MNQLYAWINAQRFSAQPNERLGAWKSPDPFPWLGWILLCTVLLVILNDLPEIRALYTFRHRMEQAISLQAKREALRVSKAAKRKEAIEKKAASSATALVQNAYQNEDSKRAWGVLGLQFQRDPAALFIALENSLTPDVGLLSVELSDSQTHLILGAEAKTIEAVEEWRKAIAHQPLLGPSRLLKEKWMPDQYGIKPVQLSLEVPVNWSEVEEALESRPLVALSKEAKKESKATPAQGSKGIVTPKKRPALKQLLDHPLQRLPR